MLPEWQSIMSPFVSSLGTSLRIVTSLAAAAAARREAASRRIAKYEGKLSGVFVY
jgi:hypothetical protein